MPSSRAILFDIEKSNLDPKKDHKSLNKKGNIVAKKETSKNSVEKLGLVFLEEKTKKDETALSNKAVSQKSEEKQTLQITENLEKETQSLNQEIEQEPSVSLEENNENKNLLEEQKSQPSKNKKVTFQKTKI